MQTLAKLKFFLIKQHILKPLHALKQTYRAEGAESLGKFKSFKPLKSGCLLHDEHPGAAHFFSPHLSCNKQYRNYNAITVHGEFRDSTDPL
jgi:hypothetical protein